VSNSPPFIVDEPLINPQPDITSSSTCELFGVVSFNRIALFGQTPISKVTVWDRNVPNPGPWAAPFTFAAVGNGSLWQHFNLNTSTGTISFPQCTNCSQYAAGQLYYGNITVFDRGNLSSLCAVSVNVTLNNVPPQLSDFTTPGVSQAQSRCF